MWQGDDGRVRRCRFTPHAVGESPRRQSQTRCASVEQAGPARAGSTPAGSNHQSWWHLTMAGKPPLRPHAGFEIGARGSDLRPGRGSGFGNCGDQPRPPASPPSWGTPSANGDDTRPHHRAGHSGKVAQPPRRCRASRHRCGRGRSATPQQGFPPAGIGNNSVVW